MPFALRQGGPADAEGILQVHQRAITIIGPTVYTSDEVASWVAGLSPDGYRHAMKHGEAFEVAVDETQAIVGFCSIKDAVLCALYIDPAWARRGLGTALLARGEAAVFAGGHSSIGVTAALTAEAFYLRSGYRLVAHDGHKTRGGLVLRVAIMEKPRPR